MDRKGKGRARGSIALMDLPLETLKAVVGYVPRKDLPNLARVSREFHPLASAEIYRVLDLRLTSHLSVDYNTPTTRVEDTLRTIVTSEHDYAQYIKVFGLSVSDHDTLDPYESHMFLNTILFLVLQKAKILESFRWAAMKGLDDSVYHLLHEMPGLQHLHVRLEPLAGLVEVKANPLTSSLHSSAGHTPPALPPHLGSAKITQKKKAADLIASRRTFSGFKHLSSLALLDIDHIEYAGEIGQCLKGSSGALKKLSLSFSKSLAMKARKPSVPHHGGDPDEDTETDPDEVDFDGAPTPPAIAGSAPIVSEADIRKERSAQETMLARIFALEQPAAARKVDRVLEASAAATAPVENPDRVFMKQLKNSMLKLQGVYKTTGGGEGLVALKNIQKAAEKYLQSVEKSDKKPSKGPTKGPMNGVFPKKPKPIPPLTPTQAGFADFAKFGDSMPSSLVDPYWSNQLSQLSALSSMSGALPASLSGKLPSGVYSFNPPYVVGEYNHVTGGPSQSPLKPPIYPHSHGSHGNSMHGPLGDFKKPKIPNNSSGSLVPDLALPLDWDAHTKEIKKHEHLGDQKLEKAKYFLEHEAQLNQKKEQELAILMDEASTAEGEDWPKSSDEDLLESKKLVLAGAKVDEQEDTMGVDIEHPDVIEDGSDDDQETVDEMEVAIEEANGTLTPSLKGAEVVCNGSLPETVPGSSVMTGGLKDALPVMDVDQTMADDHVNDIDAPKSTDQTMREYLHSKHGLPLEELSLYLIPIKANVLGRAIDLTVLKRITLLNVGSQNGLWALMTKRQQIAPSIRLERIFTDNVSFAFLACLETFQGLTELFMLERGAKTAIESFADKTNVGIEDIRKRALKRHIETLRRLMIKNDEDDAWDADAQTVRLLTSRGASLEELAIGFNLTNYHFLMQSLPGLKSLTAFRIVAFRSEDTCPWLSTELRKFTIDNLSHCPHLKLEYLAINSAASKPVSKIGRREKRPKGPHGQDIAGDSGRVRLGIGAVDAISGESDSADADTDADADADADASESEDEAAGLAMGIIASLKFCEVEGVRIFEKDVLGGKL